jgi:hypothetical protein
MELSLKDLRELLGASQNVSSEVSGHPLVGKNVIVRTVTMIYTGRLEYVSATELVLVDCSWIPETERYMQFVAEGAVRECEPYPDGMPVYVNRGALLDMCEMKKPLPRGQK